MSEKKNQISQGSGAGRAGPDAAPMPTNGDGIRALPPSVEEALVPPATLTCESCGATTTLLLGCGHVIPGLGTLASEYSAAESRALAAEEALRAMLPMLEELAAPSEGYGAFPGGDPREFKPDPECSTEEEREAHRRACALWDAGAQAFDGAPAHHWEDRDGALVHVAGCKYGLGTYPIVYDDAAQALARARSVLSRGTEGPGDKAEK